MQETIQSSNQQVQSIQEAIQKVGTVLVEGAGLFEANGLHQLSGSLNGEPRYTKNSMWKGQQKVFVLEPTRTSDLGKKKALVHWCR